MKSMAHTVLQSYKYNKVPVTKYFCMTIIFDVCAYAHKMIC